MSTNRYNFRPGFNSKGLPSRTEPDQTPSTDRGKRRHLRERKKHQHELHAVQPRYQDAERQERETFYYCRCGFHTPPKALK